MTDDMQTMTDGLDTTNCDREPIHIPGAILPHGALLVLDAQTLEILQVAGDLTGLLGKPIDVLLGGSAVTLFTPAQVAHLRALTATFDLVKPRHLLDPLLRVVADRPLDASIHRSGGALVIEFEEADLENRFAADPLAGVQTMIEGFDQAESLQALCHLAAASVREVAGYDRVLIYRFMQDDSGWVIAESREAHLEPFLDLHYPAADIPKQARALYLKSWLRLITQVNYEPAPLMPTLNPQSGLPLDMSYSILRDVSPIHRQYLRNMGIDASMSISIIRGGRLWGLIACHHYSPRRLPRHLRAICELFGSMFSLQLEAREQGEQFEERLASRMVLQNLMLNLASADDYAIGLTRQSPNLLDYIHGGSGPNGVFKGGVAVCVSGELTHLGITPDKQQIASLVEWLNGHVGQAGGLYATDRLGEVWLPGAGLNAVAAGILAISVAPEPSNYIVWFRPEIVVDVHWAGAPVKDVESTSDGDRLMPRRSFEVWKETVAGRSAQWTAADRDAGFDLRISLLHVVLRRISEAAHERKKVAERDQLLMAELDHRVKNTLANIQALVVQTSRSAESLSGFVEGLDGRIQSMAKAHSLLSQSRWEGVSLERLVREELDPYSRKDYQIIVRGPDLTLTPKSALSLSLAIHELATNAAKYGALGRPGGRVEVRWVTTLKDGIDLSWTESDGPQVQPPTQRGFGSTLIERALAMETGGKASVQYLSDGVVCEVSLPATSIASRAASSGATTPSFSAQTAALTSRVGTPFRVLVIEDSFLVVTVLEGLFEELGWELVGPATRLDEAVRMAHGEGFDAALIDVNLNGVMSWPAAAVLKERAIPFVFSTGYDVGSVLPKAFAGHAVIGKPFRFAEVEDRIRQAIQDARVQDPA